MVGFFHEVSKVKMNNRVLIASWSFLLGSALFTLDAAYEATTQTSLVAFVHLVEGVLFLVGSFFFISIDE